MNVHKNAPLTPKGRDAMVRSVVEGGLTALVPQLPNFALAPDGANAEQARGHAVAEIQPER